MTEQSSSEAIPSATVTRSRRISPVWIVPVLAAFAVGYMIYDGIRHRGPMITIAFHDAEGIVAGKSPLKFEGVRVGMVEAVHADVTTGVITLRARLEASASALAAEGSQFWIQQPEIGVGGVASLDTLISGPYVACLPGAGSRATTFDGLPTRPPVPPSEPGLRLALEAEVVGAVRPGSPVLYRGVEVGAVDAVAIAPDGAHIRVEVFIEDHAAHLVDSDSFFWELSGLDVALDLDHGLVVDTNSLRTLLTGAVAFHAGQASSGAPVADGAVFTLHRDPSATHDRASMRIAGDTGPIHLAIERLSDVLGELDTASGAADLGVLADRIVRTLDALENAGLIDTTSDAMRELRLASEGATRALEQADWIVQPDGELARTVESLNTMSARLEAVVAELDEAGTLAQADLVVTQLEASMPDLIDSMADLSDTLERIDALIASNDDAITDTVRVLRSAALDLRALLEDLRTNPSQLLSRPPSRTLPGSRP
ncbi:MAG: MlaD family protein [Phycisphaerales bacterium]